MPLRALRAAAAVEALSLLVLVLNLVTGHVPALASAVGPIHGCAYLIAIALTWSMTRTPAIRALSIIPGFGALLVPRRLPEPGKVVPRL